MTYEGKERRQRDNVRTAINRADGNAKLAMTKMARMLGPDKLAELDSELGTIHKEERRERMRGPPTDPRGRGFANAMRERPWNMIGEATLERELSDYGVSDETLESLSKAGITKIKQFISRTKEQLKERGASDDAIKEMSEVLFNWGIRTIENPPSWWTSEPIQGPQD